MKKIILAIMVAALTINMSIAQQYEGEEPMDLRKNLTFGVKAGLNLANVYDSQGEKFDNSAKLGFAGGVFMAIPLGTYLGLQPEALFSQRGFSATGSVLGSDYDFKRTTNWFDVPVLLAFKPTSTITLLAGPQFSWLLKQKYDFNNDIVGTVQKEFENENDRNNTVCLTGGIDLTLDNLVLSGRAGWDMKENLDLTNGTSTTPRYKNVWIQATIGFRF